MGNGGRTPQSFTCAPRSLCRRRNDSSVSGRRRTPPSARVDAAEGGAIVEIKVVVGFTTVEVARIQRRLVVDAFGARLVEPPCKTQCEGRRVVEGAQKRLAAFGER